MDVLLLCAYAARSHGHWRQSLAGMFPDWQWRVLELPPRHFNWRVRGSALYWSRAERACLEAHSDLLVATSTVDLAALRGLVPRLAAVPAVLYFHENQFAYPRRERDPHRVETQMVSLYAGLCSQALLFNSRYNRDTFLGGCAALLDRLPDFVPAGVVEDLGERAGVLPVPVDVALPERVTDRPWGPRYAEGGPLRLVWVGRFEYDKGPERLLLLIERLERSGRDYELALAGQRFRVVPPAFEEVERRFRHRIVHSGFMQSRGAYLELLAAADVVVSTALHEFQGIAVLEAVMAGCHPVVPERQAYPEIYPGYCCYPAHENDPVREADGAAALVLETWDKRVRAGAAPPDVSRYSTPALASAYAAALLGAAGRG